MLVGTHNTHNTISLLSLIGIGRLPCRYLIKESHWSAFNFLLNSYLGGFPIQQEENSHMNFCLFALETFLHSFVVTLPPPPQISWQSNGLPEVIYRLLNVPYTTDEPWRFLVKSLRETAPLKGGNGIYITTKRSRWKGDVSVGFQNSGKGQM